MRPEPIDKTKVEFYKPESKKLAILSILLDENLSALGEPDIITCKLNSEQPGVYMNFTYGTHSLPSYSKRRSPKKRRAVRAKGPKLQRKKSFTPKRTKKDSANQQTSKSGIIDTLYLRTDQPNWYRDGDYQGRVSSLQEKMK